MDRQEYILSGKRTILFSDPGAEILLVEPMDERDLDFLDRETGFLRRSCSRPFALSCLIIEDWNVELTPWKAAPVFGKEAFGDGASRTLSFIEDELLPDIFARQAGLSGKEVVIGGYSLAALFALWAGYRSSSFSGVAAASPSVWYPGWMEYARTHSPKASRIYMSPGDTEEKTRNKVMATAGDCIREMDRLLSGVRHTLEWNPGNHFTDTDLRTAKAFLWNMEQGGDGISPSLRQYVRECIIPEYDNFDKAHRRDHVQMVISQSLELAARHGADPQMAYAVAAYHDTGLCEGRELHHQASARIVRQDARLREWFSEDQVETIAQAVEDHRASATHEPRSLYGRIVAEADRFIDPETVIRRTVQYGFDHYPEMDREAHYRRMLDHLHEKYGRGGYLHLWFEDSPNAARLERLRCMIDDEALLRRLFDRFYDAGD